MHEIVIFISNCSFKMFLSFVSGSETRSLSPKEKRSVPTTSLYSKSHVAPAPASVLHPYQFNWLPYWYPSMWSLHGGRLPLLPAHLLPSSHTPLPVLSPLSPYLTCTSLPSTSPAQLDEPFDFSVPKTRS